MEIFSEKTINLWNICEVRVMILLSLFLQIVLITFGSRRKFTTGSWIRIIVWSAYLMADWVATVALGNLASMQGDSTTADISTNKKMTNRQLQKFWAPFLLLHLGGPDTITAYSLEDNELWLRHLFGLVVQVGVAFYIFLRSWSNNNVLTFIAIPVFISGIIKYGERNFVLRSLSKDYFLDSVALAPDPFKDVDDDVRKERLKVSTEEETHLAQAHLLFKRAKMFFADIILSTREQTRIYSIEKMSATEAFKVIEIELGFMYDVLFTKATIVYTRLGIFFRFLSFACSLSALVVFFVIVNIHDHSLVDISITYSLLLGAFLLEIYAFIILFFSDWTNLWFIKLKQLHHNPNLKAFVNHLRRFTSRCRSLFINPRRWSGSVRQYNLLTTCERKWRQPTYIGWVQKLPFMGELLEKWLHLTWTDMNIIKDLQETILNSLKVKADMLNRLEDDVAYINLRDEMLAQRGVFVLEKIYEIHIDLISYSTTHMRFTDSLVIWHIVTNLIDDGGGDASHEVGPNYKVVSKCLSNYMLYLLVFCRSMLPKEFGGPSLEGVILIFKHLWNLSRGDKSEFRKYLIGRYLEDEVIRRHEDQPLFKYASDLCEQLQKDRRIQEKGKWKIISEVWVEMLGYVAHKCEWKLHYQQLTKGGGELLTHVGLLMAHLGLTAHYQIPTKTL
ncbi:hypothetical protein JRO89_XS09G0226600 [Xanthoceras sorbifolium]|uniref:DUF4220 domain-containing protein n=1 Tax=Xanthoceras sorbifolium TaxID=99658 RepID=A0ABQ8HMI8_9ROSI|nr:hypothetical protein JRO89_XS09G0226600 [Xanthoceras sorbifolium]